MGLGSPNYESSPPTVTVTAAPPFPFLCCVRFLTACRASGARRDAATLVARFETGALMRRTEAPPPTHIPHIGAVGEEEGGDRGWAFRALHTLGNHYHKTSHNGVFIYLLPLGALPTGRKVILLLRLPPVYRPPGAVIARLDIYDHVHFPITGACHGGSGVEGWRGGAGEMMMMIQRKTETQTPPFSRITCPGK